MSSLPSRIFALVVAGGALIGCGEDPPPIEPEPPAAEGASSVPTRWVDVSPPRDASLLEAPAITQVAAEANGQVAVTLRSRVERVHVRPGTVVAAGDPIVDVGSPELLAAAAAFSGASRRLAVHDARAEQLEVARAEGLVQRDAVFEQLAAVAELRAERERAAAVLRGAGVNPRRAAAVVRRGHVTLEAPVDGVVTQLRARPGETLEPGGEPFARIVGEAPARIEVRTTEPWPEVEALTFVTVDGRRVPLAPTPISSVVDPDDGTRVSWYAPVDEDARFQDGVRGVVQVTAAAELWQVPVNAVAQRTGASFVVRRRGDAIARVPVEVVASSGAVALVRGDLRAEDQVAAEVARVPEDLEALAGAGDGEPS